LSYETNLVFLTVCFLSWWAVVLRVRSAGAELPHISSLVGGLVSQEVIKLITRQYIPMNGTCIYDGYRSATGIVEYWLSHPLKFIHKSLDSLHIFNFLPWWIQEKKNPIFFYCFVTKEQPKSIDVMACWYENKNPSCFSANYVGKSWMGKHSQCLMPTSIVRKIECNLRGWIILLTHSRWICLRNHQKVIKKWSRGAELTMQSNTAVRRCDCTSNAAVWAQYELPLMHTKHVNIKQCWPDLQSALFMQTWHCVDQGRYSDVTAFWIQEVLICYQSFDRMNDFFITIKQVAVIPFFGQ
jgi:hypothetical protein